MTSEHRFTFLLFNSPGIESEALAILSEKSSISKRSNEYIRRLIVQGFVLSRTISLIDKKIVDLDRAIDIDFKVVKSEVFRLRLNIEPLPKLLCLSSEEGILDEMSRIRKDIDRKLFLRKLFLFGYWFETLPNRDICIINELFYSDKKDASDSKEVPQTTQTITSSTKKKLGGLMPL